MPVKIFFCYAHKDETLLAELKTHLIPLRLEGLIDFWYDRDISAGMKWEQQIKEQLNAAQIILLLISPDFMASDYINNVELKRALERDERGEARVIPVILRHASWKIPTLRNLQALPTDAKPIKSWSDLDEAFVNVTEGIRKVVEQISAKPAAQAVEVQQVQFSAPSASLAPPLSEPALSTVRIKVTMLGAPGAGKTSFLLATYALMHQGINGFTLEASNPDIDLDLSERWHSIIEPVRPVHSKLSA